MKPGVEERVVAHANVLRAGRTLSICEAKIYAHDNDDSTLVASMQATMYVGD
jgi:acyl-coenzyme A thioesterase PaaI-like protein